MVMEQVYKNVFFDTESRSYAFVDENERREVVTQESYLLIYLIEILTKNNNMEAGKIQRGAL